MSSHTSYPHSNDLTTVRLRDFRSPGWTRLLLLGSDLSFRVNAILSFLLRKPYAARQRNTIDSFCWCPPVSWVLSRIVNKPTTVIMMIRQRWARSRLSSSGAAGRAPWSTRLNESAADDAAELVTAVRPPAVSHHQQYLQHHQVCTQCFAGTSLDSSDKSYAIYCRQSIRLGLPSVHRIVLYLFIVCPYWFVFVRIFQTYKITGETSNFLKDRVI